MNRKATCIGSIILLACGIAGAQTFQIAQGRATVDGVLGAGEWDKANWIVMDKDYAGIPVDLTNAAWAALWDASENVIYVAATGIDTSHVMHAYVDWNMQDGVELYINARNDNTNGFNDMTTRKYDYAQQYCVGYDTSVTSLWAVLGGGNPIPSNTLPAMAFSMITNRLVYEFKVRPFDYYNYDNVTNSTEVRLRTGLVIGLDMAINSRTTEGGFGMLCENQMGSKFTNAGNMRDYRLVSPPGVMIFIR